VSSQLLSKWNKLTSNQKFFVLSTASSCSKNKILTCLVPEVNRSVDNQGWTWSNCYIIKVYIYLSCKRLERYTRLTQRHDNQSGSKLRKDLLTIQKHPIFLLESWKFSIYPIHLRRIRGTFFTQYFIMFACNPHGSGGGIYPIWRGTPTSWDLNVWSE